MTPPTVLHLPIPKEWFMTANQRLFWAEKARRTRNVRDLATVYARQRGLSFHTPVVITCEVHFRTTGLADPDNAAPTLKAVVDGLVAAGALQADDSNHVRQTAYTRGPRSKNPGGYALTLYITETEETP